MRVALVTSGTRGDAQPFGRPSAVARSTDLVEAAVARV